MDPFLGQIALLPYTNISNSIWKLCDGSLLTIQQNSALYSLLGTSFGGDGKVNFALPNLSGRVPVGVNTADANFSKLGGKGGTETVALAAVNMPAHNHDFQVNNGPGTTATPDGAILAAVPGNTPPLYAPFGTAVPIDPEVLQATGGNAAHENMQPYGVLAYFICVSGYYPPRP